MTGVSGYVPVDFMGYDSTNKKLGLKVNGADTVIPFSGGLSEDTPCTVTPTAYQTTYTFPSDGCFFYSTDTAGAYKIIITRQNAPDVTIESITGFDYNLRPVSAGDSIQIIWKTGSARGNTIYFYPLD